MDTCSWGDGFPQYAKGLCKTHYERQRTGRPMDAPIRKQRKRIVNIGTTCAYPGCPRPRGNDGILSLCNAHQARRRLGMDMDAPVADKRRGTLQERVYRKLPEIFTVECFDWPGKRNEMGYGLIRTGGKGTPDIRVTNVVFEMFIGPIPEEHRLVRHTCHRPPCVNPAHLITGTDGDNMQDKMLAGRAAKKLTPDDIRAIRKDPMGPTAVGRKYGVSKTQIQFIRNRKQWAWVED